MYAQDYDESWALGQAKSCEWAPQGVCFWAWRWDTVTPYIKNRDIHKCPDDVGKLVPWGSPGVITWQYEYNGYSSYDGNDAFKPWWIKQATYYTGNRCRRLIENASPMRLQLLGVAQRPGISMDSYTVE